jgi:hypothetical protein
MEQKKRMVRWSTALTARGAPRIEENLIVVNDTQIRKGDGSVVRQD